MEIAPRSPNEIFELYKEEIEFAATKLGLDLGNVNHRVQLTLLALNIDAIARSNNGAPELYDALTDVAQELQLFTARILEPAQGWEHIRQAMFNAEEETALDAAMTALNAAAAALAKTRGEAQ